MAAKRVVISVQVDGLTELELDDMQSQHSALADSTITGTFSSMGQSGNFPGFTGDPGTFQCTLTQSNGGLAVTGLNVQKILADVNLELPPPA